MGLYAPPPPPPADIKVTFLQFLLIGLLEEQSKCDSLVFI